MSRWQRALLLALLPLAAVAGEGRQAYLMNCVGCHGEEGVTIARKVPDLKGQVGYFLYLPEGRDYLGRLPNTAFAPLSDQAVADMLNYLVFTVGEGSAPKNARPYDAGEVARLRRQPLTEVPLFDYRGKIVDRLIAEHQAPESLRIYGQGLYD